MVSEYFTIGHTTTHEIIINKSRFIAHCFHITSEEEALEVIEGIRLKYPDATHHCYGFVAGKGSVVYRFNDDGEPGGTAGMPILQVIQQQELKNVLVLVTRYFGGVKLGAGGLVRAYSRAAAEVLNNAEKVRMILSSKGTILIDYSMLGAVEYYLKQQGIVILDIEYTENVKFTVVTHEKWDKFTGNIENICNGRVTCKEMANVFYPWK